MQALIKKTIVISYILLLFCSITTYADELLVENKKGQDVKVHITTTTLDEYVTAHLFIRDNNQQKIFLLTLILDNDDTIIIPFGFSATFWFNPETTTIETTEQDVEGYTLKYTEEEPHSTLDHEYPLVLRDHGIQRLRYEFPWHPIFPQLLQAIDALPDNVRPHIAPVTPSAPHIFRIPQNSTQAAFTLDGEMLTLFDPFSIDREQTAYSVEVPIDSSFLFPSNLEHRMPIPSATSYYSPRPCIHAQIIRVREDGSETILGHDSILPGDLSSTCPALLHYRFIPVYYPSREVDDLRIETLIPAPPRFTPPESAPTLAEGINIMLLSLRREINCDFYKKIIAGLEITDPELVAKIKASLPPPEGSLRARAAALINVFRNTHIEVDLTGILRHSSHSSSTDFQ